MFLIPLMIYVMFKNMNNIKNIFFVIIFFVFSTQSFADIIKEIEINGNKRISNETITVLGNINKGEDLNSNQLNIILKNLYETNFFKDIKIEFNNGKLVLNIEENPIIQEVKFNGIKASKLKDFLYDNLNLKNKYSFVEYLAEKDLEQITNLLQQFGYYFVSVKSKIVENTNKTINLVYDVNLGEKAIIKKIKFTGNKVFKDRKLRELIVSEPAKFWKVISKNKYFDKKRIELDKRLLKNFFLNKGYYEVEVTSTTASFIKDNEFVLTYNIESGKKFYFKSININLPDDFDSSDFESLIKEASKIEEKKYSLRSINKLLKEIDKNVLTSQFKFINAKYTETIVDNNKINLDIFFDESKKLFVNRINILGNTITREDVIRGQVIVDEGDPYNEILFKKGINKIRSLNFFKSVNYKIKDTSDNQKKDVDIIVEEKPTGEITAGAGVGTSGTTFSAGVRENNYLGKGIGLTASLSISDEEFKGQFAVDNPNFANSGRSLSFSASSTEIDRMSGSGYKTSIKGISLGTKYEQYENLFFSPSLSTSYETLKTNDSATTSLQKQEGDYFDTTFGYSFDYDLRDKNYKTSDGIRSKFLQDFPITSNDHAVITGYEFNKFHEFENKARTGFAFWSRAANSLSGDDVRISKRVYIPSTKLRGFEFGKIGPMDKNDYIGGNFASAVTLSSTIPQILTDIDSTDISIFLDAANVWGVDYDSSINDSSKIRSSLGTAIDISTPIGPLSFTFTQPITKKHTDKTESFRFQIGTSF